MEPVSLFGISKLIRNQDNRMTMNPMFCVQKKHRDEGYDAAYACNLCWRDSANDITIYDDDKDFAGPPTEDEWEEFGYVDRWDTVMVAFTEEGCQEYLRQDGHNLGETRIYVMSFNRCPEMILVRDMLLEITKPSKL